MWAENNIHVGKAVFAWSVVWTKANDAGSKLYWAAVGFWAIGKISEAAAFIFAICIGTIWCNKASAI